MTDVERVKPMDLRLVLDLLAEVELAMARLYEWLATVIEDAEAKELFAQLAREEYGHRDLVAFQQQLVNKSRAVFPPVAVGAPVLREAISAAAVFRQNHPRPTLTQAIGFALRAEGGAAEQHYRTAIVEASPSLAKLVNALGRADDEHGARLRSFAERRGLA